MSYCYVAHLPCGCWVGATIDSADMKSETAKWVAECIRDGCAVTRTTVTEAKKQSFGRNCEKCREPDAPLFEETANCSKRS